MEDEKYLVGWIIIITCGFSIIVGSLGPGSAVWEKGEKRGQIGNCGLGRGKGWRSLETCFWWRHSMIPDFGSMLWLAKINVFMLTDSQCCWQFRTLSVSCSSLQLGKRFFKTRILSKGYKFLHKTFLLIPQLQEEQKVCLWSVAKKKKPSNYWTFLILYCDKLRPHLQSNWLSHKPTFKRHSSIIMLPPKSW